MECHLQADQQAGQPNCDNPDPGISWEAITKGNTTTLGREGSDYTAGIFAYCLEASEVSIFKDVPGVLNADPREFERKPELLNRISYKEAIEMAFFGASVIHPKTLQPLQRKEIPLRVRSFPESAGSREPMCRKGQHLEPEVPCFIVKKNQILLSVSDKEFHFVMEDDISELVWPFEHAQNEGEHDPELGHQLFGVH